MDRCLDSLCHYESQQNIKWWLIPLAIFLVILATIAVLIISFAIIPHVDVNVVDARLDMFAFSIMPGSGATATSFLGYDISVALTVRNPNRAMSIKYTKPLVATFVFQDRRLFNLTILDEGHSHRPGKTEQHLRKAAGKVPLFLLGNAAADDFKKQNATGLFKVEVRLSGEITYKEIVIAKKPKLSMSCPLILQLAPPGPEIVLFHEVNCKPVKDAKIYF